MFSKFDTLIQCEELTTYQPTQADWEEYHAWLEEQEAAEPLPEPEPELPPPVAPLPLALALAASSPVCALPHACARLGAAFDLGFAFAFNFASAFALLFAVLKACADTCSLLGTTSTRFIAFCPS